MQLEDNVFRRNALIAEGPDLKHCSDKDREDILAILRKYPECFAKTKFDAGCYNGFEIPIPTEPGKTVRTKPRRYTAEQEDALDDLIRNMMDHGLIEEAAPGEEIWTSALLVQEKAKIRLSSLAER